MPNTLVRTDDLRARFSEAMSAMYRSEVPLHGELLDIVAATNLDQDGSNRDTSMVPVERHGAIRLGTATELRTMRRVLAVIGLEPVGKTSLAKFARSVGVSAPLLNEIRIKTPADWGRWGAGALDMIEERRPASSAAA